MNASETRDLILALQACGATHFKSQDFEVTLKPMAAPVVFQSIKKSEPSPEPPIASTEDAEAATQKLKELIKTMSLPPEQLVDVIFPAGAGG